MGLFDIFRRRKAPEPAHRAGPKVAAEPLLEQKPQEAAAKPEAEAPEKAQEPVQISARELSEKLEFGSPLIISVNSEMKEVPLESRSAGKFVVCAKDGRIRLFGMLFLGEAYRRSEMASIVKHKDFHMILSSIDRSYLEGYGLELGGGELKVDHEAKKIVAQGFSGTFGRLPKSFVENALAAEGYSVQVVLGETACPDPHDNQAAVDWFRKRGVPTGDPWTSE